jgi:hypothetical protein
MFMNVHIDYFMNLLFMKISYTLVHEITMNCSWIAMKVKLSNFVHEWLMNSHDLI